VTDIILKELLKFAYNKHATHVLIKYIQIAEVSPFLEPIYDAICKNMFDLAQDANGLPVVKACIKKFNSVPIKGKMIA